MDLVLRATFVFFLILLVTRIVGRRELSSLEPFDLILLVVIGDLVQQGVTQSDYSVTGAVTVISVMAGLSVALAYANFKLRSLRSVLEGEPVVLAEDRRAKLARLREEGIDPFPHEFDGVVPVAEIHAKHDGLEAGEETDAPYRVAGRIAARRGHGKAAFIDLVDRSGRIQLHARADILGEESFERLVALDLGDLIGADGTAFKSRRGELSLRVTDWTLLAKSLLAPPEKFHGLEDVETRYRQRELDLIANDDVRELFITRSRVIAAIRRLLDERGFLEVETPVLQPLYGGALSRPFITHHNALDRDLYLRIATELYLKRLIVGGLERVYELGKDFRNEGISHKHNPEFTMLEWYEAYGDYDDGAKLLEQRARFEEQRRQTAEGDEETQPYDEDFVRALEHGMPPTSGVGLGIDRLVMVLTGRTSIREVVLFPAMRN